ncbi:MULTISPECIES: DUF4836 family protein [Niastella]|uniref:DUF4836 family protein n=1 Tax=Niastella soli TaxID=2821487 RepID=A0ABS3YRB3_9BACT|nr:DUF4836 family protein [Niastella soli]MBO9200447.1 DUF4836 family protein [Niastella soli]
MQRHLFSLLLLAVAITSIVSCSSDKSGIHIPKDASFALHVNVKSLTSKVSWQEIQQNEWFKEAYANQTDSFARKILQDPANSGIDVQGDVAVFVKKQNQGGYAAVEGNVKNATAFEAFATNVNKGGKVVKTGDVSVLNTGRTSLVAWTNNRFVFISDVPMGSLNSRFNSSSESGEPFAFSTDSLQKFAVELFDLPSKNNLMSDDRFAAVMKEPGDIHYWINAEQYYNSLGGMLSLLKMNVMFEGNVYGAALNFDNGKITFKTKAFVNKELKALMEKYAGGKVSADMINRIPSKNVAAVFAFKYEPQGFIDLLKLMGVDGMINGFLSSEGYSTAEFVKATKGDVLLAVSDFEIKHETTIPNPDGGAPMVIKNDMPHANILFATSVNEKPSFDKLFNILQKKSQEVPAITSNVHFQLNNEWFAASNSPEQVNAFLSGGNNNLPFTSRISGKSFGGYIDMQRIMKAGAPAVSDSSAKAALDVSLGMWQDLIITSGGQKDNAFVGEVEINLVDKNANSLKQLNKYLDSMAKILHTKRSPYDAQVKITDPAGASLAALEPVLHP